MSSLHVSTKANILMIVAILRTRQRNRGGYDKSLETNPTGPLHDVVRRLLTHPLKGIDYPGKIH